MSPSMPGLVQTSTNLARVVSENGTVRMQALLRSSVDSEKEYLAETMTSVFTLAGAVVTPSGGYSGWNPNMDSPILKTMTESYEALYGRKPAVMAIHAGLECGILGGKYPNLDMISFGPTIRHHPHSPDEKTEIASVGKFWITCCIRLARTTALNTTSQEDGERRQMVCHRQPGRRQRPGTGGLAPNQQTAARQPYRSGVCLHRAQVPCDRAGSRSGQSVSAN